MDAREIDAKCRSALVPQWQRAVGLASRKFAGSIAFGAGISLAMLVVGGPAGATLVAAVANGVIAIVAFVSLRGTARQARETLHLSTLHYLDEQWLRLRETREAAAQALIEDRPDDRDLDYLLDFFETVAACVEDGRVSDEQAADAFAWYATNYWHATAPYREWVSERIGATIWDCFDRVAGGWVEGWGAKPAKGELARFLRDESAPERDQTEFRAWLESRTPRP